MIRSLETLRAVDSSSKLAVAVAQDAEVLLAVEGARKLGTISLVRKLSFALISTFHLTSRWRLQMTHVSVLQSLHSRRYLRRVVL